MSGQRPDYVHCIASTHQDTIGQSLCGRKIGWAKIGPLYNEKTGKREEVREDFKHLESSEWHFTSVDHWMQHTLTNNYHLLCDGCANVIKKALLEGVYAPQ